jgi:hypothetical protein
MPSDPQTASFVERWTKVIEDMPLGDQRDTFDDDGPQPGEECGRWSNGRLGQFCAKAGSEECDFECPYRDSECVRC